MGCSEGVDDELVDEVDIELLGEGTCVLFAGDEREFGVGSGGVAGAGVSGELSAFTDESSTFLSLLIPSRALEGSCSVLVVELAEHVVLLSGC